MVRGSVGERHKLNFLIDTGSSSTVVDGSLEGDEPSAPPNLSKRQTTEELVMDEESEKEMRFFEKVRRLTSRSDEKDRRWFRFTYAPCWYSKRKTGEKRGA